MKTKNKTCLIIDDDDFARETLKDLICTFCDIDILKSLNDPQTAIRHIAILQPDLIFLDINMPGKNGMKILDEVNELGLDSKVIFVTAHNEFLLDALKQKAFDYLLKPINATELQETVNRYSESRKSIPSSSENNKITIKNSHGSLYISRSDVLFLEADGNYSKLQLLRNKTELLSKNIGKLENLFPVDKFYKISRSVIINIDYLNKIDRLKKMVHLFHEGETYKFKASRDRLYDLEQMLSQVQ